MKNRLPFGPRRCSAAVVVAVVVAAAATGWLATAATALGGGPIVVDNAWVRASIGDSKVSAAYLSIANQGESADRLVEVAAERASHTMLHRSVVVDGVMKMRHVDALEIPPGGSVRLEPGGFHVMLMGVSPRLEAGERISLTLVFERAGEVRIPVLVRSSSPG